MSMYKVTIRNIISTQVSHTNISQFKRLIAWLFNIPVKEGRAIQVSLTTTDPTIIRPNDILRDQYAKLWRVLSITGEDNRNFVMESLESISYDLNTSLVREYLKELTLYSSSYAEM